MINLKSLKEISTELLISYSVLENWKDKFEIKTFSIGDIILSNNNEDNIYIIIEGEARVRGSTKDNKNNYTLGILKKGNVIGFCTYKTGINCELVTAASTCKLLMIPIKYWQSFLNEISDPDSKFKKPNVGLSEIWLCLNANNEDFKLPNEFKSVRTLLSFYSVNAGSISGNNILKKIKDKIDKNFIFQITKNKNSQSFIEKLDIEKVNKLNLINSKARYIYIKKPESLIDKSEKDFDGPIMDIKKKSKQINKPKDAIDKSLLNSSRKENRSKKVDKIDNPTEKVKSEFSKEYKFYSSEKGVIPEATACFQMLGDLLNIPLRKESIMKILSENVDQKDNSIGLDLCAAIAESLGLKTQLATIPVDVFQRSITPLFVKGKSNKIFICFEIDQNKITLGDPLDSVIKMSYKDFFEEFSFEDKLNVLIFAKTPRTPSKKFGLSWFKPAIKKHRKALIEVLIASIFVQVFQLMNPLIIQQIIDKVIGQNGLNTLPVLAVLLFTFSVFENVLTAVRTNLFIDTTNRIDLSLGEEIIDHLLRLPLTYFDKRPVGELSSRLSEMEQIRSFLTGTALTVLLDAIFSFIYIAIMLIYSWVLTIVALLVSPILAAITFLISPVIRRQLRRKAELNANTQNHLVEILTGIQTVKAQNIELNSRWRWRNRYTKYISEGYKNAITSTTTNSLSQFLNQVSSLSVLCVGTYLVLQGQLTLGELIAFRIISGYVTTPLLRLANLYQSFQQTAISIERIGDILNNVQESTDDDKLNIPLPPIKGVISYEDLSFRFNKKGPLQLSQVSLEVNKGEFVAVVGQSGSGKSTLMKLLSRLYDPDAGKISIDGYDISKVELYSLRRQIGIVPQDSLLFEGSVEDNIALSLKNASSDEVIQAAKIACAHDFIMTLPVGYASNVGERGSNLSGGQRQRIAIARTILQNPKLLIMDEATSALDYETERKVSLNLMEFFRGTTVFFITHRLNSIIHADKIIMMHNGKIEEQGTHEELIKLKGRYFALFNQQKSSPDGN